MQINKPNWDLIQNFLQTKLFKAFKIWASKSLCKNEQLFGDNEMKSLEQLSLEYGLLYFHLFIFFQVNNVVV